VNVIVRSLLVRLAHPTCLYVAEIDASVVAVSECVCHIFHANVAVFKHGLPHFFLIIVNGVAFVALFSRKV
jgi:hypothetical protein